MTFVKVGCDSVIKDVSEFVYPSFPYSSTDLREVRYSSCPNNAIEQYEFCENRFTESHTLLQGVNYILAVISTLFIRFGIHSAEEMSVNFFELWWCSWKYFI
jgi:hypothetical protein